MIHRHHQCSTSSQTASKMSPATVPSHNSKSVQSSSRRTRASESHWYNSYGCSCWMFHTSCLLCLASIATSTHGAATAMSCLSDLTAWKPQQCCPARASEAQAAHKPSRSCLQTAAGPVPLPQPPNPCQQIITPFRICNRSVASLLSW